MRERCESDELFKLKAVSITPPAEETKEIRDRITQHRAIRLEQA